MKEIVSEIYDKLGDINGRGKEMIKAHCMVVKEIATEVALIYQQKTGVMVDMDLIETGAMIHDIGWLGIEITKSIAHGEAGYKWLMENDFPEKLARFCSTHVGSGISPEDEREMEYLDKTIDHMPKSTEEIIVAFADKFTSKGRNELCLNSVEEIEAQIKGYGQTRFNRWLKWKEMLGLPELTEAKKLIDNYNANFNC
jgi:uncharacterized protein